MNITAMKQALEALEYPGPSWPESRERAAQALRTAIAEAEKQEPVAWLSTDSIGERYLCFDRPLDSDLVQPLYTTPPAQRTWVGLTDEDKAQCIQATAQRGLADELIAAIETKLKEKNHV
jgi:hypothetical protein